MTTILTSRAHRLEHFDGQPFLFLEWQAGGDLAAHVGKMSHDAARILRLALQFCDGMMHASAQGVAVHRDIKPANCLLDANGTLKITDFGLAKALLPRSLSRWLPFGRGEAPQFQHPGEEDAHHTSTGAALGTLPYMAPEQFERARDVDVRADVYSFGVMFWELVTGEWPLPADSSREWRQVHQNATVPPFPTRPSPKGSNEWRTAFGVLLTRCLNPNPRGRPADFAAVRRELEPLFVLVTSLPAPPIALGLALDAADWCQKGWSQLELSLPCAALESFARAQELAPREGEAFAGEIAVRRALGEGEATLRCGEKAVLRFPNYAPLWLWRARTLRENGDFALARAAIGSALGKDELEPDFWAELGQIELEEQQWDEAARAFTRARRLNPRHEESLTGFALACRAAGHSETALRAVEAALAVNPRFELALQLRDELELEAGRGAQILARLDERIARNPQCATLWADKGRVLLHFDRAREAIECFDRALSLDSHLVAVQWQKARAWGALGRIQEALKCADAGLAMSPCEGEGHFVRGELLAKSGRETEAYIAFWRANAGNYAPARGSLEACRARLDFDGLPIPTPDETWVSSVLSSGSALAQDGLRVAGEVGANVVSRLRWPGK